MLAAIAVGGKPFAIAGIEKALFEKDFHCVRRVAGEMKHRRRL